jgi:tetratricopeptide (TPR) repeat protein
LLDAVGRVYQNLDFFDQARPPLEEALVLRREHLAPDDPVVAESLHNLAGLEREEGHTEIAESLMRDALAIQRRAFPRGHPDLARGLANLGSLLQQRSRPEAAEPLVREALAMQERLFGQGHIELAIPLNNLARILVDEGRFEEAETLYRRSIEIRRTVDGPDDPGLANALNNLAMLFVDHLDRPEEALPLYEESVRIRRKVYGEGHSGLVSALNNLALLLTSLERYEEARILIDEALAIYADHPDEPVLLKNKTLLHAAAGEYTVCEELIQKVLPRLHREDRIAEAKSLRGACLAGLGRREEAGPLLREGYQTLLEILGEDARQTRQAGERLAEFDAGP